MIASFFILLMASSRSDAAWLSGWNYRKSHVINSATGAGTDYQVKITAHYGAGTDSNADVYLGNHSRTDFGDIRFTGSDGTTLLDYWMGNETDSNNAVFWVEVAGNLSTVNQTIYVYYGNSTATTSNGTNTFLFFDDFNDGSLDTNKWTWIRESPGNWDEGVTQSGWLNIKTLNKELWSTTNIAPVLRSKNEVTGDIEVRVRIQINPTVNFRRGGIFFYSDDDNYICTERRYGSGDTVGTIKEISGAPVENWASSSLTDLYLKMTRVGTTYSAWYSSDEISWTSLVGYSTTLTNKYLALVSESCSGDTGSINVFYDNLYARKYVSPEPGHGVWGGEEGAPHSSYKTMVGSATDWAWKIVYSTDTVNKVPSGTPTDWQWRTWEPGSGRKVPQGTAADWTWGPE